jgi:membrane carboxypeptidase/penicillin-binding protein
LPIIKEFLEKASAQNLIEPLPFRAPSDVSMIQVNAKTGRRAYPGDAYVIWESFMSGESPDNQQTVYGGETVVFDEPDMNYKDLFNQIPTNDNGEMLYPEGHVSPENENPTLQGTGGIY